NFYEAENVSDSNLWELFQDDFGDFTAPTFSQVKLRTQQVLRDCLRSRGVYISKNSKRKTISQTLFDCLQEEEQHEWTDQNLDDILKENYDLKSPKLARRLATRKGISTNIRQPTTEPLETLNKTHPVAVPSAPSNASPNIPLALLENNQQNNHSSPLIPTNRSPTNFGKEIANMAKIYTEEQKYSGTNESLDFKLRIFYDICHRADVPQEAYLKALPTMLKGLALDIYYMNELSNMSFQNAIAHLRNYFQGPEFQRKNLSEWNSITLKTVMAANPEKSTSDCLMLLIQDLGKLQHGFREALQTVEYLHDKLVTACQGVPACRTNNVVRRCYVCQKEDCRSWNHTDQERQNYKNKFRNEFKNKLKTRSFNDNHFQKRFRQYTVDCEGSREDYENDLSETELDNVFDSLVVNFTENSPVIDPNDMTPNFFCTSYGQMGKAFATSILEELSNKAFNHLLTASNSMNNDQPQEDDPFAYNTRCASRYTSTKFMGIMIDTGASNRSTAGYAQFLALQKITNVQLDESFKDLVSVQFGIGSISSIGSVTVNLPVGNVEFHIVDIDTPFLLCLADMDKLHIYFNNLKNFLVTNTEEIPIVRRFGHPFLLWDRSLQTFIQDSFAKNPCCLTTTELKRLHKKSCVI
ncbi:hypothetical protein K3495_g13858, partial [Podosphaera aphanis]